MVDYGPAVPIAQQPPAGLQQLAVAKRRRQGHARLVADRRHEVAAHGCQLLRRPGTTLLQIVEPGIPERQRDALSERASYLEVRLVVEARGVAAHPETAVEHAAHHQRQEQETAQFARASPGRDVAPAGDVPGLHDRPGQIVGQREECLHISQQGNAYPSRQVRRAEAADRDGGAVAIGMDVGGIAGHNASHVLQDGLVHMVGIERRGQDSADVGQRLGRRRLLVWFCAMHVAAQRYNGNEGDLTMAVPAEVHEQLTRREARLLLVPADEAPPPRALRERVLLSVSPAQVVGSTIGEPIVGSTESHEKAHEQVQRWHEHVHEAAEMIRWADDMLGILEVAPDEPARDHVIAEVRASRAKAFDLMQRLNPEQAWFWTEEWQAGEREVDREIASGHLITGTPEEFDAALDAIDAELA